MREEYEEILNHFENRDEVELPSTKGAQGLKYRGKMFAMFYKGDLTVKLSPKRVLEAIESKEALPHDPGTGKPMKDRVLIPYSKKESWIKFCEESLSEVKK